MMPMYRIFLILLACLLSLSCSAPADEPTSTTEPPTLTEFVDTIISEFGENDAFAAVALALDRGYSPAQIVDGGMNGKLSKEGAINGTDPSGPPPGILTSTEATSGLAVFASNHDGSDGTNKVTTDVDELRAWLESQASKGKHGDLGGVAMVTLLRSIEGGYTLEQIVEAFIFGYDLELNCDDEGFRDQCTTRMLDETGARVQPNKTAKSSPKSDIDTIVFRGTGQITTTYDPPSDETVCEDSTPFELTLLPDGTAKLKAISRLSLVRIADGTPEGTLACVGDEDHPLTQTGTHSDGEFSIPTYTGTTGEITGSYDGNSASGKGTFSSTDSNSIAGGSYEFTDIPVVTQ